MERVLGYEAFVRNRITELRMQKNISEHRLSLDLGKSPAYIRSITNGLTLPSFHEFFNILQYFEISPSEFFRGAEGCNELRDSICETLRDFSDEDLEKIATFIKWISK